MKLILSLFLFLVSSVCFPYRVIASPAMTVDTCLLNDECHQAMPLTGIVADQSFFCITGCNMYASPDSLIESCQMGDFPTVWYTPVLGSEVRTVHIEVRNADFESPVISVFKSSTGCTALEQVYLSNSNLACIIGSGGQAQAVGIEISPEQTYYIAISSIYSIGGTFDLCVSALSTGSYCVMDRGIEVVARSNGGPLEGPFDPGETVSVCMNVYSYTAAGNGCQWFQGLVPVFGNGWDINSFDQHLQPLNAKINGDTIGEEQNGLYGASTWDWFTDVDYHHDHPTLTVMDLDSNGRYELCNSAHEIDCPYQGMTGGCCGPCWQDTLGEILPGGWFAYGINGTCPIPGPPIRVDWGDGNSCGNGMGPWHFCFDLVTRQIPDCAGDSTRRDLSLGFFTFADGEIGAWTGNASVCSYDIPTKLSLKAKCGRVSMSDTEVLEPLCSGDTLRYLLESPDVQQWEWNISPFWAAPYVINRGNNGILIEVPLDNASGAPVDIHATLIGHEADSGNIRIRQFTFKLKDEASCGIISAIPDMQEDDTALKIHPNPANDVIRLEWSFDFQGQATLNVFDACGMQVKHEQVPSNGNQYIDLSLRDVPPGVYYLGFSHESFRYVKKVVRI